ncbi:MAG TPA: hypothetical protein VLH94_00790 [Spirochaetia bacterium]|nr:hypothetical protein [Spirochaetia bacterium]
MNANKDENGISVILGTSCTDGKTVIPIKVSATSHALMAAMGTSGTDKGPENSPRDENSVPTLMGISSVDEVTPVPIYCSIGGKLLIDNT